jgi:Raf kinase inhibitor-like YbhB/YbcL family protein
MRPLPRVSTLILVFAFAAAGGGCSSSSSNKDGAAGNGGGGGSAGGSGGTTTDGSTTDSAASIQLTSTAFTNNGNIPAVNTCADVNTSPPLSWTPGPAGTMSYAITLTDLDFQNLVHWVIWDIPSGTTALPENLARDTAMLTTPTAVNGAKQARAALIQNMAPGPGYFGPCPMGNVHRYQFEVNAIGTATLAGVTTSSTTDQVKAAVQGASLAHGDLIGMSAASPPAGDGGGQ